MARKNKDHWNGDADESARKTGAKKAKKALARAQKALARAQKSVDAARRAVRASTKKLRRKASALSDEVAELTAKNAEALRDAGAARTAADARTASAASEAEDGQARSAAPISAVTTVPAPAEQESAADQARLTPPLPKARPTARTLVALRQQAKEQKLSGYFRMSKADLIAALGHPPE